jgi:hypothetical protein
LFSFILVVCLAGVFCLAPLGLYLLWLAVVNRRPRPTVIRGTWDFALLLAGLSGFILFGGGLLLSLLQSNVRFWMRGNFEALRDAWGQEHLTWSLIVAGYLIVVVGGSVLGLLARKRSLVVYNIDPAVFEGALAEVCEELGRPVERRGNLWVGGVPLVELEPFAAGHAVTLRWLSDDDRLYEEVERRLRETLPTIPTGDHPVARWLMSGAVGAIFFVTFCTVLLAYGLAIIR